MRVVAIEASHRERVNQIIKDEWAGPLVVTRGKLLDTATLPGFVCIEDDDVVGAILYDIRNAECEIAALISYRGNRGIGTELIQAAIAAARAESCTRVWLITTNDNTHAIRYYQRRGFALKCVHINAIEASRKLKPEIPLRGIDDIPILHEFEFEWVLTQ